MKLTETQLKQFERILEEKGYRKYVCKKDYELRTYDLSSVCQNESWHWYKSIEKVRDEDEYKETETKYNVLLYIAFWDYTQYPASQEMWVAGTQVVVKIYDDRYYNTFEFPFYQEKEENNLFFDYDPEAERDWYKERNVTDKEIESLISNLEILALECSAFYRKEAQWIINRNLRYDTDPT